jgi:hypothetical protein
MDKYAVKFDVVTTPSVESDRIDMTITSVVTKGGSAFFDVRLHYTGVPAEVMPSFEKAGRGIAENCGVKVVVNPSGFIADKISLDQVFLIELAGMELLQHLIGMGFAQAAKKGVPVPLAQARQAK